MLELKRAFGIIGAFMLSLRNSKKYISEFREFQEVEAQNIMETDSEKL